MAVVIVKWNFPFFLACGKVAPAIAAGCTMILKPRYCASAQLLALVHKMDWLTVDDKPHKSHSLLHQLSSNCHNYKFNQQNQQQARCTVGVQAQQCIVTFCLINSYQVVQCAVAVYALRDDQILEIRQDSKVPMPLGKSGKSFFSYNFRDMESLVLESPGIYLWFNLTNMPFMYRTPCVNKCMKYLCCVLTKQFVCNS